MMQSLFKTRKRKKICKQKKIVHKSPCKRWFRNGFHSLLRRADARGSADIIYGMAHIAIMRFRHSYWGHKVCHAQNI